MQNPEAVNDKMIALSTHQPRTAVWKGVPQVHLEGKWKLVVMDGDCNADPQWYINSFRSWNHMGSHACNSQTLRS